MFDLYYHVQKYTFRVQKYTEHFNSIGRHNNMATATERQIDFLPQFSLSFKFDIQDHGSEHALISVIDFNTKHTLVCIYNLLQKMSTKK